MLQSCDWQRKKCTKKSACWLLFVFPQQCVTLWITTNNLFVCVSALRCWMHCIYSFYTDVVWMFFYESVSRAVLQLIVVSCRLPLYSCCGAGVQDSCGAQLKCCAYECRMEFAGFGKKKNRVGLQKGRPFWQPELLPIRPFSTRAPQQHVRQNTGCLIYICSLSSFFFFFLRLQVPGQRKPGEDEVLVGTSAQLLGVVQST